MNRPVGWSELEAKILDLDVPGQRNLIHGVFLALRVVFPGEFGDWTEWFASAGRCAEEETIVRAVEIIRLALRPEFSDQLNLLSERERAVLTDIMKGSETPKRQG